MNKAMAVLLVLTGGTLLYSTSESARLQRVSEFWRGMYQVAAKDAAFVNCVDFDKTYVICERPK